MASWRCSELEGICGSRSREKSSSSDCGRKTCLYPRPRTVPPFRLRICRKQSGSGSGSARESSFTPRDAALYVRSGRERSLVLPEGTSDQSEVDADPDRRGDFAVPVEQYHRDQGSDGLCISFRAIDGQANPRRGVVRRMARVFGTRISLFICWKKTRNGRRALSS